MSRSAKTYYILPSAISITPNANESSRDLAVYIARGTKIKVFDPRINDLGMRDGAYQEWTLMGRNRRLASADVPYAIYARLRKVTDWSAADNISAAYADAYLVFAAKTLNEDTGEWEDPYVLSPNTSPYGGIHTTDSRGNDHTWQPIPARQAERNRASYWWVKLGEVSAPDAETGERAVTLDTGILGTEAYNAQWVVDAADAPLRVEVYYTSETGYTTIGTVPYMEYGGRLMLLANLVRGWSTQATAEADHWGIVRDTGDADADAEWNAEAESTAIFHTGAITLEHARDGGDLGMGQAATFTITAYDADNNILASTTQTILAEYHDASYEVTLDFDAATITVDDVGNVIGGLWTAEEVTDAGGDTLTLRTYRLHAAVFARRNGEPLTLADSGLTPGVGQYQIYPSNDGQCTLEVVNGTLYVTAIENILDGVADTADVIDYASMRAMKEATASVVVSCEGRATYVKSYAITIYHQEVPFIAAALDNHAVSISWGTRQGVYRGVPFVSTLSLLRNNTALQLTALAVYIDDELMAIDSASELSAEQVAANAAHLLNPTDAAVAHGNGWRFALSRIAGTVTVTDAPQDAAAETEVVVRATVLYAGASYERSMTINIHRTTDTNVYELWTSQTTVPQRYVFSRDASTQALERAIIADFQNGALTVNVSCDNDQSEHYQATAAQLADAGLWLAWQAFGRDDNGGVVCSALTQFALNRAFAESDLLFTPAATPGHTVRATRWVLSLYRAVPASTLIHGQSVSALLTASALEDEQAVEILEPTDVPCVIGLSNDTDAVVYDTKHRRIGELPTTTAWLRVADTDISELASWRISCHRCTATLSGCTISVIGVTSPLVANTSAADTDLSVYIDIIATYNSEEYTARFSIGYIIGAQSKFYLRPDADMLVYDAAAATVIPATLDVSMMQWPGVAAASQASGLSVYINNVAWNGTDVDTHASMFTNAELLSMITAAMQAGVTDIEFRWQNEGQTDSERITIVQNVHGRDGQAVEYVYRRATELVPGAFGWDITDAWDGQSESSEDYYSYAGAWTDSEQATHQPATDGFYPRGWTPDAEGVTELLPYEWCAVRVKQADNTWGAFGKPFVWSAFGKKGRDGAGVEYIFRAVENTAAAIAAALGEINAINAHASDTGWQSDGYLPAAPAGTGADWWEDEPVAPTITLPIVLVSQRKRTYDSNTDSASWGVFSTPVTWARFGADGRSMEYIFKATTGQAGTDSAPVFPAAGTGVSPAYTLPADITQGTANGQVVSGMAAIAATDDFVPDGWSDDALAPSKTNKYVWVSHRKSDEAGLWGAFSEPVLYTRHTPVVVASIERSADEINTDARGITEGTASVGAIVRVLVDGDAVSDFAVYDDAACTTPVANWAFGLTSYGVTATAAVVYLAPTAQAPVCGILWAFSESVYLQASQYTKTLYVQYAGVTYELRFIVYVRRAVAPTVVLHTRKLASLISTDYKGITDKESVIEAELEINTGTTTATDVASGGSSLAWPLGTRFGAQYNMAASVRDAASGTSAAIGWLLPAGTAVTQTMYDTTFTLHHEGLDVTIPFYAWMVERNTTPIRPRILSLRNTIGVDADGYVTEDFTIFVRVGVYEGSTLASGLTHASSSAQPDWPFAAPSVTVDASSVTLQWTIAEGTYVSDNATYSVGVSYNGHTYVIDFPVYLSLNAAFVDYAVQLTSVSDVAYYMDSTASHTTAAATLSASVSLTIDNVAATGISLCPQALLWNFGSLTVIPRVYDYGTYTLMRWVLPAGTQLSALHYNKEVSASCGAGSCRATLASEVVRAQAAFEARAINVSNAIQGDWRGYADTDGARTVIATFQLIEKNSGEAVDFDEPSATQFIWPGLGKVESNGQMVNYQCQPDRFFFYDNALAVTWQVPGNVYLADSVQYSAVFGLQRDGETYDVRLTVNVTFTVNPYRLYPSVRSVQKTTVNGTTTYTPTYVYCGYVKQTANGQSVHYPGQVDHTTAIDGKYYVFFRRWLMGNSGPTSASSWMKLGVAHAGDNVVGGIQTDIPAPIDNIELILAPDDGNGAPDTTNIVDAVTIQYQDITIS